MKPKRPQKAATLADRPRLRLVDLYKSYIKEAELAPSSVKRWTPLMDRLVSHLGHDDPRAISRGDIVAWKDALLREGIQDIGAAIEFKFVRCEEDIGNVTGGIVEDTAGYRGSKDWVRFYSVFYQLGPFMMKSRVIHDLKRVGALTWKVFVVNGSCGSTKGERQTSQKGDSPEKQTERSAEGRGFAYWAKIHASTAVG